MRQRTVLRLRVAALVPALALAGVSLLLPAAPALARNKGARFVGKVVTSAMPLTPSGDEETFFSYLAERNQTTISHPANGSWPIYLIAFFAQPIGASECHVALYALKSKQPPRFVEAFGQRVSAEQDNLSAHIELSPERFSPGEYELRVTRLVDGKEKVYAKTRITLE